MLGKMSPEKWGTREPLRMNKKMREDAAEQEKEDRIRAGEEADEHDYKRAPKEQRVIAIKRKNILDDHQFFARR